MNQVQPNTFLIGAQKSATTSVFDWIAQHPDVCGPISLKDFPFFARDDYFEKGLDSLSKVYVEEGYQNHKIVLQGCVQYMFYPQAIDRIYSFNPDSKLILILRNPVYRAISAYSYFHKMKLETLSLSEALDKEQERVESDDFRITSELTYVEHGYYGKQLEYIFQKFDKKNVLVLKFEDVQSRPEWAMDQIFSFLDIDPDFTPDFTLLNRTGKVRFKLIQNAFFKKNAFRKFLVNLLDPVFPLHKRQKMRLYIKEWNTASGKKEEDKYEDEKMRLKQLYKNDIDLLESITGLDFGNWK